MFESYIYNVWGVVEDTEQAVCRGNGDAGECGRRIAAEDARPKRGPTVKAPMEHDTVYDVVNRAEAHMECERRDAAEQCEGGQPSVEELTHSEYLCTNNWLEEELLNERRAEEWVPKVHSHACRLHE